MAKIAVVGGGVSGLACAYTLARHGAQVVLYEKEDYVGGHARTVTLDGLDLDLGFMPCNRTTYSEIIEFLEELDIQLEVSDMSFGVSVEDGNGGSCEWTSNNLFARKMNAVNFSFWKMLYEIKKFKNQTLRYFDNDNDITKETMGQFIQKNGYSKQIQEYYLIPMCASIWSCSSEQVMGLSSFSVLSFFKSHLQGYGQPQWLTIKGLCQTYVNKVVKELEKRGCEIKTSCYVTRVTTTDNGVLVTVNGKEEFNNKCVISVHAPDALDILGMDATIKEHEVLGAYQYAKSDVYLHRDKNMMPKNSTIWSALNFLNTGDDHHYITYWLNTLQNLGNTRLPYLITQNPPHTLKEKLMKWSISYPIPSMGAFEASKQFHEIQGKRGIWFCGTYHGYGFHEDGVKTGLKIANDALGLGSELLISKMQSSPTWIESGCRVLVINFLKQYIQIGCLCLNEDGGIMLRFGGRNKEYGKKVIMRIHKPEFYWKIATRMDLGLADSYINGDFTFEDDKDGLLNLLMILIANKDVDIIEKKYYKRGWWIPIMATTIFGLSLAYMRHISRRNSLTQARRNIARHYDLSNDLFSLYLDETMTYSCAIFNQPGEPLRDAQMRKLFLLIKKAHLDTNHEVLEIGCGWGSLAIEVVKLTGCQYTGITLSEEQFKFAQERVKKVGLEDKIALLLCDYREIPCTHKYNCIISCGMIEHVGNDYHEEFFRICENRLQDNGRLVLQFVSVPEQHYDEYQRNYDFIKEYIFPGGCLPSLGKVISAMTNASKLRVEHTENIGPHYYFTLMEWRKNFHSKKSDVIRLGFGQEFIRMWDYYFVYFAAAFRTLKFLDYQVVFSKPKNVKELWNDHDYDFLQKNIILNHLQLQKNMFKLMTRVKNTYI